MNKFTQIANNGIDHKISKDLDLIKKTILKEFNEVVALILVGGFGRGEGSVIMDEGEIRVLNDYDLVMVSGDSISLKSIKEIKTKLASELNIWRVDVVNYMRSQLCKLRFSMFNYDLKYGGYIFYGDSAILDSIPFMDPAKMPLFEGEHEFFSRMWCFLGPFSSHFLSRKLNSQERFFLCEQMTKAILTVSDAYLLLISAYHVSFQVRMERFCRLYSDKKELVELVRKATKFKLFPSKDLPEDMLEHYFKVKRIYLEAMLFFVSRMYRIDFKNFDHYAQIYFNSLPVRLKNLVYILLKRSRMFEKNRLLNLAQLFLVLAIQEDGFDQKYISRANILLNKALKNFPLDNGWESARKRCLAVIKQ